MIGQEAFHVSGVTGNRTDTRSELVNALMGKQTPIFEGYDVFGNVFKFGHHVRRDEEAAPGTAPFHDVSCQSDQFLVERVSGGDVHGSLNLVKDSDGSTRGQRDGTGQDGSLPRRHFAQLLTALQLKVKTLDIVVKKFLIPRLAQRGIGNQRGGRGVVEVPVRGDHDRVSEQVIRAHLRSIYGHVSCRRREQTTQDLHERRLSRAVGSYQGGDGCISESERDIAQGWCRLPRIGVADGVEGNHERSLAVVSAL
jgi:hypothetical protein